jgi:8-oxo-dGTP pyrophosphatase MutT (NUDIX family)
MTFLPYLQNLRDKIGNDLLLFPAVCGLVFNADGQVLLGLRSDNHTWAPVGGMMEPEEEPAAACVREVLEETGITCLPVRITGVYLSPIVRYANGDRAQYVITTFYCNHVSGTPRAADDESLEVRYFPVHALPPLKPHHLMRIRHALAEGPAFFAPAS